jgi:ubiquitin-conjugating enzyme E2 J2
MSSLGVKRLSKEYKKLQEEPVPNLLAKPLETDIFQWRFLFKGESDSPYAGGLYMGGMEFPNTYPHSAPKVYMITPNGRFNLSSKGICMSFTNWHPESWNPALGVRTILLGLISFFYEDGHTAGALKTSDAEKRELASKSIAFNHNHKDYIELFQDNELETPISKISAPKIVIIKRKKVVRKGV